MCATRNEGKKRAPCHSRLKKKKPHKPSRATFRNKKKNDPLAASRRRPPTCDSFGTRRSGVGPHRESLCRHRRFLPVIPGCHDHVQLPNPMRGYDEDPTILSHNIVFNHAEIGTECPGLLSRNFDVSGRPAEEYLDQIFLHDASTSPHRAWTKNHALHSDLGVQRAHRTSDHCRCHIACAQRQLMRGGVLLTRTRVGTESLRRGVFLREEISHLTVFTIQNGTHSDRTWR